MAWRERALAHADLQRTNAPPPPAAPLGGFYRFRGRLRHEDNATQEGSGFEDGSEDKV